MRKDAHPPRYVTPEQPHKTRCTAATLPTYHTGPGAPHVLRGGVRDMHHKRKEGHDAERIPEAVFDYAFKERVAVLVIPGRRTHILFAHVVPRKGLAHEHGAQELIEGVQKLGYHDASPSGRPRGSQEAHASASDP